MFLVHDVMHFLQSAKHWNTGFQNSLTAQCVEKKSAESEHLTVCNLIHDGVIYYRNMYAAGIKPINLAASVYATVTHHQFGDYRYLYLLRLEHVDVLPTFSHNNDFKSSNFNFDVASNHLMSSPAAIHCFISKCDVVIVNSTESDAGIRRGVRHDLTWYSIGTCATSRPDHCSHYQHAAGTIIVHHC